MKIYRLTYNYKNNILDLSNFYSESSSEIVNKVKELNLKYYEIDFFDSSFMDNYKNIMWVSDLDIRINHAFFKATFKKLL